MVQVMRKNTDWTNSKGMVEMKFVATFTTYEQVSEDTFNTVRNSAVFDYCQPIGDVIAWLGAYKKNPTINDVVISHLDEIPAASVNK
jgi:hypothetical protein